MRVKDRTPRGKLSERRDGDAEGNSAKLFSYCRLTAKINVLLRLFMFYMFVFPRFSFAPPPPQLFCSIQLGPNFIYI